MFNKGEGARVWSQKYQFLWSFHMQGQLQPGKVCRGLSVCQGTAPELGFCSYIFSFDVTENLGSKSFYWVSSRGQGSKKKDFYCKANTIIWINLFWGKTENTDLKHKEIFSYRKAPFWIIIVSWNIQPVQWAQLFNKQILQWCLTSSEVSAKWRTDGNPEKSQGAHKVQVTAVPSSTAASTGSFS